MLCEHAELGRCDGNHYFRFHGDIYRYETQWFDEHQRQIATYEATDYPRYCEGASTILIRGARDAAFSQRAVAHLRESQKPSDLPVRNANSCPLARDGSIRV